MKKILWFLLILILLGFGGWYLYNQYYTDSSSTYSSSSSSTPTINLAAQSYQAVIKAKNSNSGLDTMTTLNFDADSGNAQLLFDTGAGTAEIIYANSASYFRQNNSDTWLMGASATEQYSGFAYTPDQISQSVNYVTMASNEGQQACGSSMCTVWSYDDGTQESRIFLENGSDQLRRLEYLENGNLTAWPLPKSPMPKAFPEPKAKVKDLPLKPVTTC